MSSGYELPGAVVSALTGAARVREIEALYNNLDKCQHGIRGYQNLPRHMQRRAVSTNSQRLPLAMRNRHNREIKGRRKITKRPNRKYKRRPTRLVSNHNHKHQQNSWLQTHVWHAKHFHMIKRWGYTIPKTPSMKSYRATLRAARNTCLIQDVSYENCFELQGTYMDLIRPFENIISSDDYLILKNGLADQNSNWIDILLYQPQMYPYEAVGLCQMILACEINSENLKLWLFVHPSISCEVLKLLINLFNLVEECDENDSINRIYSSKITPNLKLSSFKDTLSKFRLSGPESCQVLKSVLIPTTISCGSDSLNGEPLSDGYWWKSHYSDESKVKMNDNFNCLWAALNEPPVGLMLGLTIRDPRFILPKKKTSVKCEDIPNGKLPEVSKCFEELPIFNENIRNKVNSSMSSTHYVNTLRSRVLVPGTPYPLNDTESRVPVLLLGRGTKLKPSRGFDLILPYKWAACTWLALSHNGAVAAGQDEEECLIGEFLTRLPSYLMPDTLAGVEYAQELGEQNKTDYFKRPQNCRLNFLKQGVTDPFNVNWLKLIQSWDDTCEQFFVFRDKGKIDILTALTCKLMSVPRDIEHNSEFFTNNKINDRHEEAVASLHRLIINNALIYVHLIIKGKGTIEDKAMICLPSQSDLESLQDDKNLDHCHIMESNHRDPNIERRKQLKALHKTQLNRLRKLKKKAKERVLSQERSPFEATISLSDAVEKEKMKILEQEKDIVRETGFYEEKMNSLWLETTEEPQMERQVMGYVTDGRFSIRMGRPGGTGWVAAKPLLDLMKSLNVFPCNSRKIKQIHVLLRNPSSMQYRWARLVVIKF